MRHLTIPEGITLRTGATLSVVAADLPLLYGFDNEEKLMIRRYCDCCETEITDTNRVNGDASRLTGEVKRRGKTLLRVEVITAKESAWNDGDFCKYCVIDAINTADDRPRPAV